MIERNTKVFYTTQFNHSLIFVIPIWIVYYQGYLTAGELSTLVIIQYAFQMIMELPSGALADILGRKIVIVLSFLLGAITYMLLPFANIYEHFILLAVLGGMADSLRSGSEEAIVYDTYKERESHDFEKVFAKGNVIYQAGLIIGSLFGGWLYQLNFALPFVLYGLSLLMGMVASIFYVEPELDSEKFTVRNYIRQIKQGIKEVFKDKLTSFTSLYYIAVAGITWTNALYFGSFFVVGLGFGDMERGFIQGGARLMNALIFTLILSKVRLNEKFKILLFPVMMMIAFLPGVYLEGWLGVPFFILAMFSTTARWIFLTPITNKTFTSKVRATAISVLSLLIGFVYIFVVGISGPIIERVGINGMYTVLGVLSLMIVFPLAIKLLKVKELL